MTDETRIRADFSRPQIVPFDEVQWRPSPADGVHRKMLDRIGDEVARATSIVRYAPESSFDEHEHGGGEEILVLDGVLSDESGDYPAGTYLRNPPGSRHAPGSKPGCIIFVKLRQFDEADDRTVRREVSGLEWLSPQPGTEIAPLHNHARIDVRMVRLAEGTEFSTQTDGGLECLVFRGRVSLGQRDLEQWAWMRVPDGGPFSLVARSEALLYVKSGHLSRT
jgi:anti-sigma factor ChrR (cupin superfamily)